MTYTTRTVEGHRAILYEYLFPHSACIINTNEAASLFEKAFRTSEAYRHAYMCSFCELEQERQLWLVSVIKCKYMQYCTGL